jgi:hypothetical protein
MKLYSSINVVFELGGHIVRQVIVFKNPITEDQLPQIFFDPVGTTEKIGYIEMKEVKTT